MAELAITPLADKITNTTYRIYDGACGTGGILTVAEHRMKSIADECGKKVSIYLYGQELQPETYAIARSDMMIKGEGKQAERIAYGSTISNDAFPRETFDFMISNPPFGTPWKKDLEAWGLKDKKDITDSRFIFNWNGDAEYSVIPNIGDPQMLFLANNISKMKTGTPLGSRIVEVHNGSSLFTGSAGQGESNLRRYIIERDWLEAIIALPENMFYNTGIGTYLWIVTNKKSKERKGKIQLIDATSLKSPIRKNLGEKNGEISPEIAVQILQFHKDFDQADPEYSRVFNNNEFGYWEVPILRPLRDENGKIVMETKGKNKGNAKSDRSLSSKEIVPFTYEGGVKTYFKAEIQPYVSDAWFDEDSIKVGYEISFTKYFYKPAEMRSLDEIITEIEAIERDTDGLLSGIIQEVRR